MGGIVSGILNAVGLIPDAPDMTPVANATAQASDLAAKTAQQQLDFAKQQYADQKPLVDAAGKAALASNAQDQAIAKQAAERSQTAWTQNQNATQGAVGQMGLNALGAQYLNPEQTSQLQAAQAVLANPAATPEQRTAAQSQLAALQKAAETAGIGLEQAKGTNLVNTAQGQADQVNSAFGTNATATKQGGTDYASGLADIGSKFGTQAIGIGEQDAQAALDNADTIGGQLQSIAKQRAADFEKNAGTQANADIANSADQANRQLLRLGGDPNKMAAMGADIANSQQLARIGSGNQVASINIANLNAADDKALGLKSSALDAARASRTQAKETALGMNLNAAQGGLSAVTSANQSAADKTLQGNTTGQSLTFNAQNQANSLNNNAKDKVDAGLNSLQQGAANYGAGFANTSGQNAQNAVVAGTAGVNGLATAVNSGNQTTSTTLGGMNGGMTAAQIQNTGALGLANANTNQYNAEANAINGAVKNIAGMIGTNPTTGIVSDKKAKKNRKPVDDDAALEGLEAVAPESWSYKKGVADGGKHVGPMAQDMNEEFGEQVAPGGKQIDVISNLGLHHAAIRALAKKVGHLERRRA
jgi:hypothetical protein